MKPLLITDCDEVLLHMVKHFGVWVGEAHDIDFAPNGADFATALTRRDGSVPTREEMWGLLDGFFPDEMHRQTLVPHAAEALERIATVADVVVLTNLQDVLSPAAHRSTGGARHPPPGRMQSRREGRSRRPAGSRICAVGNGVRRRSGGPSRFGFALRAGRSPAAHGIGADARPACRAGPPPRTRGSTTGVTPPTGSSPGSTPGSPPNRS